MGEPHWNPSLRQHYGIGKVLTVLRVSRQRRHAPSECPPPPSQPLGRCNSCRLGCLPPARSAPPPQGQEEEAFDRLVDRWVLARAAVPEQQAAALRLLAAVLDAWLFQWPLTEEPFMERLVGC